MVWRWPWATEEWLWRLRDNASRSERVESPGTYVTERVSRSHFCLAQCSLRSPSRVLVVITWRGMDKLQKGRNYGKSRRGCQVYGLRGVCSMIVCYLTLLTLLGCGCLCILLLLQYPTLPTYWTLSKWGFTQKISMCTTRTKSINNNVLSSVKSNRFGCFIIWRCTNLTYGWSSTVYSAKVVAVSRTRCPAQGYK